MPDIGQVSQSLLPLAVLVIATCLAYMNAWPDSLVYDDKLFGSHEPIQSLSDLLRQFSNDVWVDRGSTSNLYRPLLFASVAIDARLFGSWFAGYHLTNILIHACVVLLLYWFLLTALELARVPRNLGRFAAFLAALLFAIHPVHTEVVNSIFNRSILLAAAGMLTAMCLVLRFRHSRPILAWSAASVAFLLSLFSRETAVVLPGLLAAILLDFSEGTRSDRVKQCLPVLFLLLPLSVYVLLRLNALSDASLYSLDAESAAASLNGKGDFAAPPFLERVLFVFAFWLKALEALLWPFSPRIAYPEPTVLDRLIGAAVFLGIFAISIVQFLRGRKGLLAGIAIFCFALLPASRVIFPGSAPWLTPLAERYLYIASIGAALLLAPGFAYLVKRFDRLLAAAPALLLMVLWLPVVWARNEQWHDEVTLFESDYALGSRSNFLLRLVTAAHLRENDIPRVLEICDENKSQQASMGMFASHCASAYSYAGRDDEAENAYRQAAGFPNSRGLAHSNFAQHYMRRKNLERAREQFEQAVEAEADPARKEYYAGLMLVNLYPRDHTKLLEARKHFENALLLRPGLQVAETWKNLLDQALGPVNVPGN